MRDVEVAGWTFEVAETAVERMWGLLGRRRLDSRHALVLLRCSSVHTIGMRLPIDVIAFDVEWRVVYERTLEPNRIAWPRKGVRNVIETAAGGSEALSASLDGRTIREALGTDRRRT
jgi:uncharacterized protein